MNAAANLADSPERSKSSGGRGGFLPLAILLMTMSRLGIIDPLAFYALPDGVQELHVAHTANEISGAYKPRKGAPQSAADAAQIWNAALARTATNTLDTGSSDVDLSADF